MNNYSTPFHYVIFADDTDYLRAMFFDVLDNENVEFIAGAIPFWRRLNTLFVRIIYRAHFNRHLNKFIPLPFKSLWYRNLYRGPVRDNICFVFFMDALLPHYIPLFEDLRHRYPGCKLALYIMDLVKSRKGELDMSVLDYFDVAISYDKTEAEKYQLLHYPNFMSKLSTNNNTVSEHSDFCFIGAAKNRVCDISSLYKQLSAIGYKCDFIVYNHDAKELGNLENGIQVIDSVIPYSEYLEHINNCDCIVEIQQEESSGYTLRTLESLIYGKKLLTGNKSIKQADFYDSCQFMVYSENMDERQLQRFMSSELITKGSEIEERLSPVRFLDFISEHL